ncbi:MAG: ATP-binding protein [Chloroflexia bacterium]
MDDDLNLFDDDEQVEQPEQPALSLTHYMYPNSAAGASGGNGVGEHANVNQLRRIGTLITVELDRSPNFRLQHFRVDPGVASPRPGALVAVETLTKEGRFSYILARVSNVWERNPHEDALSSTLRDVLPIRTEYAEEGSSTVIYRVTEIEPLEEALLHADGSIETIRDVQTLPRAGSPVYEANDELVERALGLEPDPDSGLHIGHVRGQPDIPVVLNRSVIQRHIFIGGGVGSGKSWTRGRIGEELQTLGVPQINIDVNGEMVEATKDMNGVNLKPGVGFKLPLSAFTAEDIINAVPSLGGNMIELVRHAHEELLKESLRTGGYFLLDDLLQKIEEVGPELEMKAVTIRPALSRTESLRRIKYLGEPFDWASALKTGSFINIVCRGMLVTDLRIITAAVARDIQRLAQARKIPFVILSIDEFHLVAPANEETVALQVLRELARLGRHLRIGLILVTQSPQDVDKSILKRLLTRFLHAIEPDQLDALRGVFSDASEDLIKQLPKMPQGVCILTGAYETIKHATVIEVGPRLTTHGGSTPDIWADFEAMGWVGKRPLGSQGRSVNE